MKFLLEIDLDKLGTETLANTLLRVGLGCNRNNPEKGQITEISFGDGPTVGHYMISEADE